MIHTIRRTQQPGGVSTSTRPRWTVRWLATLAGLLVALTALSTAPASGQDDDDPEQWRAEQERKEREEQELQQQYGSIGCTVVPGFNDRCPTMVSWPVKPFNGGTTMLPRTLISSPDGRMLYAIAWEHRDRDLSVTVITAFLANTGDIVWSQTFGRTPETAEHPDTNPWFAAAVSHDGSRLYVAGRNAHLLNNLVDDGWVAAFDTATGGLVWAQKMKELLGATPTAGSTPAALVVSPDDHRIFVSTRVLDFGDSQLSGERNEEAWHLALDSSSGELIWKTSQAERKPNSTILFNGSRSLALSPDGSRVFSLTIGKNPRGNQDGSFTVLVYDASTGQLLWEQGDAFPPEDGLQNQPAGLIVSPDGSRLFVAAPHDARSEPGSPGRFYVSAYDTASGATMWSEEYSPAQPECAQTDVLLDNRNGALAISPSGSLLYLAGLAMNGRCGGGDQFEDRLWGPAVFALQAATGDVEWSALHGDRGEECVLGRCFVAVAPGPGGGDAGSQVFVTANRGPPWSSGHNYSLTLAYDGRSGDPLWQGRYLDTFNDGETLYAPTGGSLISSDGTRLYVLNEAFSRTRGWTGMRVMQVIGYDITRLLPDLTLTSLTTSKAKRGHTELRATVLNIGTADASGVVVRFLNGENVLGDSEPVTVETGDSVTVRFTWDSRGARRPFDLSAIVNPDRTVTESNYDNNQIQHESAR